MEKLPVLLLALGDFSRPQAVEISYLLVEGRKRTFISRLHPRVTTQPLEVREHIALGIVMERLRS